MNKLTIQILSYVFFLGTLSCHNKMQDKNVSIQNISKIEKPLRDTLLQLSFNSGLKIILDRESKTNSKLITFWKGDSLIAETKIPTSADYNGFSLDKVRQEDNYLLISTEHGSINYYRTDFYFSLSGLHPFALEKIKSRSFNKKNPDKWDIRDSLLAVPIPVKKFDIGFFLDNEW